MLRASSLGLHVRQRHQNFWHRASTNAPGWSTQRNRELTTVLIKSMKDAQVEQRLPVERRQDVVLSQQHVVEGSSIGTENGLARDWMLAQTQTAGRIHGPTFSLYDGGSGSVLSTDSTLIKHTDGKLSEFVEGCSTDGTNTVKGTTVLYPAESEALSSPGLVKNFSVGKDPQPRNRTRRKIDPALHQKLENLKQKYNTPHHQTILTTNDVEEAWSAFEALIYPPDTPDFPLDGADPQSLDSHPPPSHKIFTKHHLRRLAHLIVASKPPTRTHYLRLRRVVTQIQNERGRVPRWIWNALVNLAGRAWRKVTVEDYRVAVGVYSEMLKSEKMRMEKEKEMAPRKRKRSKGDQPDLVTFTTLVDIASRTLKPAAVRHALSLYSAFTERSPSSSSEQDLGRLADLALLRFRMDQHGSRGVWETTWSLEKRGQSIGTDGLNAFLWAQSKIGRSDVALNVYENLLEREEAAENDGKRQDVQVEGISLTKDILPDVITHLTMIQVLTYNGELHRALGIFTQLIANKPPSRPSSKRTSGNGTDDTSVLSNFAQPIFRALFLGFFRNTRSHQRNTLLNIKPQQWTLANFDTLLDCLFSLPADNTIKLDQRTLYWILISAGRLAEREASALSRAGINLNVDTNIVAAAADVDPNTICSRASSHPNSGSRYAHGAKKQRELWSRLQERFGVEARGRLVKLVKLFS